MGWGERRAKFITGRGTQQVPHIAFHTFRLLRRAQKPKARRNLLIASVLKRREGGWKLFAMYLFAIEKYSTEVIDED